ncbi:MAG: phosphoribosyltransferase family protein [Chitinophagales bacterium]
MKKTQILDWPAIQQKTRRMAHQIVEDDFEDKEIVIIGIKEGGFEFARMLEAEIRAISSIKTSLISLSLSKKDPSGSPIALETGTQTLDQKTVLLVDDVANTGRTMYYALKPIMEFSPCKVQIAVLVDRQHKLFPIASDFVGLSLSTTLQEHITVVLDGTSPAHAYLH